MIQLGRSSRKRGNDAEALRCFTAAAEAAPQNLAAAVEIASTLCDLQRPEEAEARFRAVLARAPGNVAALSGLAKLALRQGDPTAGLKWLERAAALDSGSIALQAQIGRALLSLGRLEEADARFRRVITHSPGDAGALASLAEIARRRGDLSAALAFYEKAAMRDPAMIAVQVGMAGTLRTLERFDEAEARYRAVLERLPGHTMCLEGLGDIAQTRGDLSAALTWFETAAVKEPRISIRLKIARVLHALKRDDAAEACYMALLKEVPEDERALLGMADIARARGHFEAALARFQAAAAIAPCKPMIQLRIAGTLLELLRVEEAEDVYRSVLQASPEDVGALVGLGSLERKRGNHAASLALFESAAAKAPDGSKVWFRVISALNSLGRFEEAGAILEKLENSVTVDKAEMEVSRFQHYCLTMQLAKAEQCTIAWQGHRNVPKGAVNPTAQLYAALGRWSDVMALIRERIVEGDWVGEYDLVIEPLARAARATGRYAEACELLESLPNGAASGAVRDAHDQIVEEMRLLQLLDPSRSMDPAIDTSIGQSFRADRAELFEGVLQGRRPDLDQAMDSTAANSSVGSGELVAAVSQDCGPERAQTQIFMCTDAAYMIGAGVSLFSLLNHNRTSLRDYHFTVYCDDNVLDLGFAVFGDIGAAFGVSIDIRASSSLISKQLDLRTGWGTFSPGRALSQAAYYRIYAARQLIDEGATGRALYIDADTCVFSGLESLVAFDLAGHALGVRLDDWRKAGIRRAAGLLGVKQRRYFNSGVLLFDPRHPELRAILDRSIEISLTEQHRLTFVDQCALNLAFREKFVTLPDRFNMFVAPDSPVEDILEDPLVMHFITQPKPWDPMYATRNCMPWLRAFLDFGRVVSPDLIKRLLAFQFPTIANVASPSL